MIKVVLVLLIALAFAAALVLRLFRTMEKVAVLHQDLKSNNDKLHLELLKLEKARIAHEAARQAGGEQEVFRLEQDDQDV